MCARARSPRQGEAVGVGVARRADGQTDGRDVLRGGSIGRMDVLRGGSIFLLLMDVDDSLIVNVTVGC
jgi:hypothetical protein